MMALLLRCTLLLCFIWNVDSAYLILATDEAKSSIYHAYVDSPGQENIEMSPLPISITAGLSGVDFDPIENKVYWTQTLNDKFKRAFLNGSEKTAFGNDAKATSITIDVLNRNVYWGGLNGFNIYRRNIIDRSVSDTISDYPKLDQPYDVAIDQLNRYIYISDKGRMVIEKMHLEEGNRHTVVAGEMVCGIDVDSTGSTCYAYHPQGRRHLHHGQRF